MKQIPSKNPTLLVIDDDTGLLTSIHAVLISAGFPEPALLSDGRQALDLIQQYGIHLVLLDLMMPEIDGLQILKEIKSRFPQVECIVFTAVDDVETAIQAIRHGAYDYLVKGQNNEKLILTIQHALERYNLRQERSVLSRHQGFTDLQFPEAFKSLLTRDDAMAMVFRQVEAVAPTDYSVVISGESGTGKEVLAKVVHRLSNRSEAPFLPVNMAAFSGTLFEDEFFGHTKGAYTNAVDERKGLLEEAQGGSLFLDEITELDLPLQGKLLRVIEEKELYRLGSTRLRNVDVRFIAATNRDIPAEIEAGRFRPDLYYRLSTCSIKLPPLRERRGDILPLARHFLALHATRNEKKIHDLAPELQRRLQAYHFPGNIRELQNIIASAVLVETSDQLQPTSVAIPLKGTDVEESAAAPLLPLAEMEREHIRNVLKATRGDRAKAAEILGINLSTVYRKIKRYGLR
jgi:DNA-binding NtrC family response regulator